MALGGLAGLDWAARAESAPDYTLEIGAVTLELAPRHTVKTTGYNGSVPGPLLRLKEGRAVTIDVTNRTDHPEVVHWHGLFLPVDVDGALEEGTPPIPAGATTRLSFAPRPAGFRWYHTHVAAMDDLTRGQYGGQHGFLMIEPATDAGRYDRELFLALHDWSGYLEANEDGALHPAYALSSINGKMLGAGEPLRVKAGERVLLHILNSSPTEVHWLALAGHTLEVIALDGNPVPSPRAASMLRLAPAERVCALVRMDHPGVWILGEVRKHVQAAGMGVVVEYAGARGMPQWQQAPDLVWDYAAFAAQTPPSAPPSRAPPASEETIAVPLVFESRFRGHGAMEAWTINGRSFPDSAIAPLEAGRRYRFEFINSSSDPHPLHLHRHSFEIVRLDAPLKDAAGGRTLHGLIKDVVLVEARSQVHVEFTADHPGNTLMHCHQQDHMDMGFMLLIHYA